MKKQILTAIVAMCAAVVTAQTPIQSVLDMVEQQNPQLRARRELTKAQSLEAKMGNSLENPTVEYDRMWGSPSALGKTGEFTVTQAFDLPMAYIYRNNAARARAQQYGYEYADFRQQLLFEAQSTYIGAVALQQSVDVARKRMEQLRRMSEAIAKRFEHGDASIIERNRAAIEVAGAVNDYELLRVELRGALNRLSNMCGGATVEVAGVSLDKIAEGAKEMPAKGEMEALYVVSSPKLLAAVSQVDVAREDIRVSRSQSLPKLELGYRNERALGERFNGVVMGVSIPMFGNRHNVKRAKAQQYYAEVSLEGEKLNVNTLLSEMYDKFDILREALDAYGSADRSAGNNEELLNKAFAAGQISIQDYISEVEVITTVAQTRLNLLRDYLLVCAQIRVVEL